MKTVLITGSAGFIGFSLAERLLQEDIRVIGVDNLNSYYDIALKKARLARLESQAGFQFHQLDLTDSKGMQALFESEEIHRVVHLAAQPGVRYSVQNPHAYVQSNVVGFLNVLEGCRHGGVEHLVFASSSSVYGGNTRTPFSVQHGVDHPLSLYAATKKSSEMMAHSYAHLFDIPVTGLRFFTVYGPWGRPDMAYFLFTKAILEGRPIDVFNHGRMRRDFTYIDDVLGGVVRLLDHIPTPDPTWSGESPDPSRSNAPYRLFNIGNNNPIPLMTFLETLEEVLGKKAEKRFLPMQDGDVHETYADIDALVDAVDFRPSTPLRDGLSRFVSWYREYHQVG
ncbi:MAG: NAD-dependent epimerase [Magnetococcales bacterium]|nr:NAD-dependent epimerase [Magnetococcales bacterium]